MKTKLTLLLIPALLLATLVGADGPLIPVPTVGRPCCAELYPPLFAVELHQFVDGVQTLAFRATGEGPYTNEDNPVIYAEGDTRAWGWYANAWNQGVWRVRARETVYDSLDALTGTIAQTNYWGREEFPEYVDCTETDSLTYGRWWAGLLLVPGLHEIELTAWECPGAEPITLSAWYLVEAES